MAAIYQIRDWDRHFENNKSRLIGRCSWVSLPNKQHGMGYSRVVSEPDGAAIYGVFVMMVCACSQQESPRSGWLTDDGTRSGAPWGPADLALKFRRPKSEIERAIEVLTDRKIGWLTAIQKETGEAKNPPAIQKETVQPQLFNPQSALEVPLKCLEGMEGMEGMEKNSPAVAGAVSDHKKFFSLWTEFYPERGEGPYVVTNGAKDGAHVKRILAASGLPPEELVGIARQAWKRPDLWNCEKASTISGFCARFNEIRSDLKKNGSKHTHQRPEPALKVKRA